VLAIAEGAPLFLDFRRRAINPVIEHASQAGIGPELVFSSPAKGLHALRLRMQKMMDYAQSKYKARVVCHNHLLNSQLLETEAGLRLVGNQRHSMSPFTIWPWRHITIS